MKQAATLLIATLFLSGILGASSSVSPKDEPKKASAIQAPTNPYQPITFPSPILVKVIPNPDVEAEVREEDREEDRDGWDRAMDKATITLAFITFFLAIFTGGLWYHTYQLAKGAENTAKSQSDDMKESLRIARESADSTKAMVETMKENVQTELRAYIGIESIKVLQGGVEIIVCNRGATPAHKVLRGAWYCIGTEQTRDEILAFASNALRSAQVSSDVVAWKEKEISIIIPLTSEQWDQLYGLDVYICGIVKYEDVFEKERRSCFQFLMTAKMGKWNFSTCITGNDAT
jgi:hypothetical protein